MAARRADGDLWDFLISLDPRGIHYLDHRNKTPLFYAIKSNKVDFIEKLLSSGTNLEHRDDKLSTVLYSSIAYCKTVVVELLLRKGADVNIKSSLGRTPLAKAGGLISLFVQAAEDETVTGQPGDRRQLDGRQQPHDGARLQSGRLFTNPSMSSSNEIPGPTQLGRPFQ